MTAEASVRTGPTSILASVMSLCGIALIAGDVHAMSVEQMRMLAGAAVLDVRVDAALKDCGLPSFIADTGDVSRQRQTLRWGKTEMKLSSTQWEIVYSRHRGAANHGNGWLNPGPGAVTCLAGLSGLVLHAKGDAGFLSVKKRPDSKGYLTTYHVPDDLYAAHQVIGLTGSWKQGMPVSTMEERYGTPDEIPDGDGGVRHYRYWVVVKQKEMPVSVYAVDFEVPGAQRVCTDYSIHANGFGFVQEKLDALQRQWERDYVLD